jgi:L-malate glycosyltransferase
MSSPQIGSALSPLGVCHIISGDLWAGAEVQVATLLRSLVKDRRLDLSAIVLNRGRLADEIASMGIALRVIPESENSFRAIVQEACQFISGRRVEIIHSHRYKENLIAAWASRRCKVPHMVRTQHGLRESQHSFRALRHASVLALDYIIARWATDRIISVSDEMSHHLAKSLPLSKIVTIPNGLDSGSIRSSLTREEAKSRLGIPANCPVIGTAGRLEPVKRLDIFLRAAAVLIHDTPSAPGAEAPDRRDIRFVIAGKGREGASLQALSVSLGLRESVLFLGHRDDLPDVLRAFDVLAISSDHEGLPMVLLEALALGVPVVARPVGGIPEVIQNGENGILVNSSDPRVLADAILAAFTDRALSARLMEQGIKSVQEKFHAAKSAARVAELYLSLCGRP